MKSQIEITERAAKEVQQLKLSHQDLIFHHCICENNEEALILIPKEEMYLDDNDILLGSLFGVNYYINIVQYSKWKNTPILIDIIEGEGSSFSLEYSSGIRFIINAKKLELEIS